MRGHGLDLGYGAGQLGDILVTLERGQLAPSAPSSHDALPAQAGPLWPWTERSLPAWGQGRLGSQAGPVLQPDLASLCSISSNALKRERGGSCSEGEAEQNLLSPICLLCILIILGWLFLRNSRHGKSSDNCGIYIYKGNLRL